MKGQICYVVWGQHENDKPHDPSRQLSFRGATISEWQTRKTDKVGKVKVDLTDGLRVEIEIIVVMDFVTLDPAVCDQQGYPSLLWIGEFILVHDGTCTIVLNGA